MTWSWWRASSAWRAARASRRMEGSVRRASRRMPTISWRCAGVEAGGLGGWDREDGEECEEEAHGMLHSTERPVG